MTRKLKLFVFFLKNTNCHINQKNGIDDRERDFGHKTDDFFAGAKL